MVTACGIGNQREERLCSEVVDPRIGSSGGIDDVFLIGVVKVSELHSFNSFVFYYVSFCSQPVNDRQNTNIIIPYFSTLGKPLFPFYPQKKHSVLCAVCTIPESDISKIPAGMAISSENAEINQFFQKIVSLLLTNALQYGILYLPR